MLVALLVLPVLAGLILLLIPRQNVAAVRAYALVATGLPLLLALKLAAEHGAGRPVPEVVVNWLPMAWPVTFHLGLDGVGLVLVLLTALAALLAAIALWPLGERLRGCLGLLLWLEAATFGVFLARDLAIFYLFWDLMLIPSFLLLLGWGGSDRRQAALKYILYNGAGGLLMLLAVVAVGVRGGTFELAQLAGVGGFLEVPSALSWATWAFWGLALGFLVKVPVFPLHGWMADTYRESPAPIAAFLSGVQSKAGLYGLLKVLLPLFPAQIQAFGSWIAGLALVGLVYGSLIAVAERRARHVLAYASLAHLGLIVVAVVALAQAAGGGEAVALGVLPAGQGAVVQMLSHGLFQVGLFLVLDAIERRFGTSELGEVAGLARQMPRLSGLFLVLAMAALGLPGLSGFAGEFLMLLGIARVSFWYTGIGLFGAVMAAVYMVRLYQGLMNGPVREPAGAAGIERADVGWREALVLLPLAALVVWLGLQPAPVARQAEPALLEALQLTAPVQTAELAAGAGPTVDAGVR